jgi:hypothetical protein
MGGLNLLQGISIYCWMVFFGGAVRREFVYNSCMDSRATLESMAQRELIVLLLFGFGKKFTTESTEDTEIRGRTS